jgi:tetratricopeptide (TPR) repeat protein
MILRKHMYRAAALLSICLLSLVVYGQQSIDVILKARALSQAGRSAEAVRLLTQAIDETGGSLLYTERAEAYIAEKDLSAAARDFSQANSLTEHSGDYGLARIYALRGDAATSMYHLGLHMGSAYRKSEKEIMLDPAFHSVENRPEWRQLWKKEWYDYTEKSIAEIEFLTSKGKIEESRALINELKKYYPESEDVLYAEALISLESGRYSESVTLLSRLTTTNPGDEKYLRLLARAQTGQSNPAGASVTYSKLLGSGIADAELFILRAECYRKTRESDKAIRDIEKYLEYYPENKKALSLAGKVEAESGDNLKALEYFSKNLKLHPNDPECYIDRADSYFVSRSWDWAVRDYSMSLDLNPDNSSAWLNKGIALLSSGKTGDACYDFRRSYSLGNQKASSYIGKHCLNK